MKNSQSLKTILFHFRFEEFGSLIFLLPILFFLVFNGKYLSLFHDAEKISLLIALGMILIFDAKPKLQIGSRFWAVLRDFAPLFFVLVVYSNISILIDKINPKDMDNILSKLEKTIFGMHYSVYLQRFLFEPLISFATISYATYYFFPPVLALMLYVKGKYEPFRRLSAAVLLSFFIGYVGYILVPAVGPRYIIADQYSTKIKGGGLSKTIRQKLDDWEYTKRDCFPSLHNAVILLCLLFAFKYERKFAWFFLPFALGLFFATVYLRYHYMIDVLAGWGVAVFCFYYGPKVFHYWNSKRRLYGFEI